MGKGQLSFKLVLAIFLVLFYFSSKNVSAEEIKWIDYVDARYGFLLSVPENWFIRPAGDEGYGAVTTILSVNPTDQEVSGVKIEFGMKTYSKPEDSSIEDWILSDYPSENTILKSVEINGVRGWNLVVSDNSDIVFLPYGDTVLYIAKYHINTTPEIIDIGNRIVSTFQINNILMNPLDFNDSKLTKLNLSKEELQAIGPVFYRPPMGGETFNISYGPFCRDGGWNTHLYANAVDITKPSNNTGIPVFAAANGRVTVSDEVSDYGNRVEIEHDDGNTTRYAHLAYRVVVVGDRVVVGEKIGEKGGTGTFTTGYHLHFEFIDPNFNIFGITGINNNNGTCAVGNTVTGTIPTFSHVIDGYVIDSNNNVVVGATVSISGTTQVKKSKNGGNYSFFGVDSGAMTINAYHPDFGSGSVNVNINSYLTVAPVIYLNGDNVCNGISAYDGFMTSLCGGGGDSTPPTGAWIQPGNGSTISSRTVTLGVNATDNSGGSGVKEVRYSAKWGGQWYGVGSDSSYPYSYSWDMCNDEVPNGDVELGFEVWDNGNNKWVYSDYNSNIHITKNVSNCDGTIPGGDGITLHQGTGYSGTSSVLLINDYSGINPFNDLVRSITISGPFQMVIYEHDQYNGNHRYLTGSVSDLGSEWRDDVSSFRVKRTSPVAFSLYELGDLNGNAWSSDRTIFDLGHWDYNDRAESMYVAAGYEVVACPHNDFLGNCGRIKGPASIVDLNALAQGLRDGLTSVHVCLNSCPPGATDPILTSPSISEVLNVSTNIVLEYGAGGTTYYIEVWGGSLTEKKTFGWTNDTHWNLGNLPSSDQPYYWHVRANNGYGESGWTEAMFYVKEFTVYVDGIFVDENITPAIVSGELEGLPSKQIDDLKETPSSSQSINNEELMHLYLLADNMYSIIKEAYFVFEVKDPFNAVVPALSWEGNLTTNPGKIWWYLERNIPSDAFTGYYTFTGKITFSGKTTSRDTYFFVNGISAYPEKSVLSTPTGTVTTLTPSYTWEDVGNADEYLLAVKDTNGTAVIWKTYTAGSICSANVCTATPANQLVNGNYTWLVIGKNSYGDGTWSDVKAFTVNSPIPGKPGLASPAGTITDQTPAYQWGDVGNATQYLLVVKDSDQKVVTWLWKNAADICSTGNCVTDPGKKLGAGNYSWWVMGRNNDGDGAWSTTGSFTIEGTPAQPSLNSPNGTITDQTPSYSWIDVYSAENYLLVVKETGTDVVTWLWKNASEICSAGTCTVDPGKLLGAESYTWWVLPKNATGNGFWSLRGDFTIEGTPTQPELYSPTGTIADDTPEFNWEHVYSATQYVLVVKDSLNNVEEWTTYNAADICVGSTCSVTPSGLVLNPDSYTWQVLPKNSYGNGFWSLVTDFTLFGE